MKETDFIRQNQEKWATLEQRLRQKGRTHDFENLSDSFVELSEDLSYAQTYYGRRTVRVYLNTLAQRAYKKVFNARRLDKQGRMRFWSHDLPTALWESRIELTIAFVVFLLAVFIGVVSSEYDDGFAGQILGSNYIHMTEENIAKGDPMGVYKDSGAIEMFFRIMLNNLQVSVITFVLGILFGVGTLGILVRNGIMLGVFQYFFVQRDIGFESFLTIWQHGTIEIASIVVAGGAGLVLGRSIIFPGTLPRSISLKFGMIKGLKVLLGVAPLIVLAAFIESFYTRFDDLHMAFRLATILASLAFVFGYYIWLPIKRGRSASLLNDVAPDYSESHVDYELNLNKLKSVGEILGDTLVIVQRNLPHFMRTAMLPAFVGAMAIIFFLRDQFSSYFYFLPLSGMIIENLVVTIREVFLRLELFGRLFEFSKLLWFWPLMAGFIAYISRQNGSLLCSLTNERLVKPKANRFVNVIFSLLLHMLLLAPFIVSLWYTVIYLFFILPAGALTWYVQQTEGLPIHKAFSRAFFLVFKGFLRNIGTVLMGVLFSLLAAMLIQSPTFYILFELGNDFIGFSEGPAIIIQFAILLISLTTLFCGIEFLVLLCILNYRSVREIVDAPTLLAEIEALKLGRR